VRIVTILMRVQNLAQDAEGSERLPGKLNRPVAPPGKSLRAPRSWRRADVLNGTSIPVAGILLNGQPL
jgi:hypothetical protein